MSTGDGIAYGAAEHVHKWIYGGGRIEAADLWCQCGETTKGPAADLEFGKIDYLLFAPNPVTSPRDSLAALIRGVPSESSPVGQLSVDAERIADMILAAGWISLEQQYQMRARVRDEFVQRMTEDQSSGAGSGS